MIVFLNDVTDSTRLHSLRSSGSSNDVPFHSSFPDDPLLRLCPGCLYRCPSNSCYCDSITVIFYMTSAVRSSARRMSHAGTVSKRHSYNQDIFTHIGGQHWGPRPHWQPTTSLLAHSMSLCNREASVVRLSVNFAQIATSTTEVAGSLPNLHTMVPRRARIQDVLKVKVNVEGHVIRALL